MKENITQEKIDELFEKASKQLSTNIVEKYTEWLKVFETDISNPVERDAVIISYVQTQTLLAIKRIFDDLFTE